MFGNTCALDPTEPESLRAAFLPGRIADPSPHTLEYSDRFGDQGTTEWVEEKCSHCASSNRSTREVELTKKTT